MVRAFADFKFSSYFASTVGRKIELDENPLQKIKGNKTIVFYISDPHIQVRGNEIFIGNDKATFCGKAGSDIYLMTSGFAGASQAVVSWKELVWNMLPRIKEIVEHHRDITHVALRVMDWEIIPVRPREAGHNDMPMLAPAVEDEAVPIRRAA